MFGEDALKAAFVRSFATGGLGGGVDKRAALFNPVKFFTALTGSFFTGDFAASSSLGLMGGGAVLTGTASPASFSFTATLRKPVGALAAGGAGFCCASSCCCSASLRSVALSEGILTGSSTLGEEAATSGGCLPSTPASSEEEATGGEEAATIALEGEPFVGGTLEPPRGAFGGGEETDHFLTCFTTGAAPSPGEAGAGFIPNQPRERARERKKSPQKKDTKQLCVFLCTCEIFELSRGVFATDAGLMEQ